MPCTVFTLLTKTGQILTFYWNELTFLEQNELVSSFQTHLNFRMNIPTWNINNIQNNQAYCLWAEDHMQNIQINKNILFSHWFFYFRGVNHDYSQGQIQTVCLLTDWIWTQRWWDKASANTRISTDRASSSVGISRAIAHALQPTCRPTGALLLGIYHWVTHIPAHPPPELYHPRSVGETDLWHPCFNSSDFFLEWWRSKTTFHRLKNAVTTRFFLTAALILEMMLPLHIFWYDNIVDFL